MEDRIKNGRIVEDTLLALIKRPSAEPRDDLISFLLKMKLMMPGEDPPPADRPGDHGACQARHGRRRRHLLAADGITLFALLTHPSSSRPVKADRALIADAIEEGLRWNPTAPYFYRMVMDDVEFYGHHIPEGSVLELGLGPANRDPSRWERPDEYDIHREKLTNMAFGLGTHRCLGMNVARVEIETGINALLDAFPNFRLDPNAEDAVHDRRPRTTRGFRPARAAPVIGRRNMPCIEPLPWAALPVRERQRMELTRLPGGQDSIADPGLFAARPCPGRRRSPLQLSAPPPARQTAGDAAHPQRAARWLRALHGCAQGRHCDGGRRRQPLQPVAAQRPDRARTPRARIPRAARDRSP
jgi:hypothetical protein